jgi:hypothetical protein
MLGKQVSINRFHRRFTIDRWMASGLATCAGAIALIAIGMAIGVDASSAILVIAVLASVIVVLGAPAPPARLAVAGLLFLVTIALPAARYASPYSPPHKATSLPLVSLLAGILGASVVAIAYGHAANHQSRLSGQGRTATAIAGLVLGYINVTIAAFMFCHTLLWQAADFHKTRSISGIDGFAAQGRTSTLPVVQGWVGQAVPPRRPPITRSRASSRQRRGVGTAQGRNTARCDGSVPQRDSDHCLRHPAHTTMMPGRSAPAGRTTTPSP